MDKNTGIFRLLRFPIWTVGVLAGAACGAMLAACFYPLGFHWLAWVAMVPFMILMPRMNHISVLLGGTILGWVWYRLSLGWLLILGGPWVAGIITALGVLVGLSFWAARVLMKRWPAALLWATPLAFIGQEVIRSQGLDLYRLPYVFLGGTQSYSLWIAQLASVGGIFFVSGVVVAVNAAVAWAIIHRTRRAYITSGSIIAAILVLAAVSQPGDFSGRQTVSAACVQSEKYSYKIYANLTEQAASLPEKPYLIVLPEHTIADMGKDDESSPLVPRLEETAKAHGLYVIVGAHSKPNKSADCFFDNVLFVIGPTGKIILRQLKLVPVPFYDDGNPGDIIRPFGTPHGLAGAYVCIDGEYPDHIRRLVSRGAGVLLGPVFNNEKWPQEQRWQQADLTIFRCIEQRRCMVRASSSGISHITDATGRNLALRAQADGDGVIAAPVYFNFDLTFYNRAGYLIEYALGWGFIASVPVLIIVLIVLGIMKLARFKNRPIIKPAA